MCLITTIKNYFVERGNKGRAGFEVFKGLGLKITGNGIFQLNLNFHFEKAEFDLYFD